MLVLSLMMRLIVMVMQVMETGITAVAVLGIM
jgi:hypothetical protein